MKVLYIDCGMGAAGDMLTAALLELLPEAEQAAFIERMNTLGLGGVNVTREKAVRCGIQGTRVRVTVGGEEEASRDAGDDTSHENAGGEHMQACDAQEHTHDHAHSHSHSDFHAHEGNCGHVHDTGHGSGQEHDDSHAHDAEHICDHRHEHDDHGGSQHSHAHTGIHGIEHIVRDHMDISDAAKDDVMSVFDLLARAESEVHGVPVRDIHFHEVGTMDAVADITAVCLLMEMLAPDRVVVSPIHVGSGYVRCAHGILPVPAPATANILKGVPIYSTDMKGELCTPTGAALLKHFADDYGSMPVMKAEAIGYGMGSKDFAKANCVRVLLGEAM